MNLHFNGLDPELERGLNILAPVYGFQLSENGTDILVRKTSEDCLAVTVHDGGHAEIVYHKKIHFFRALGILLEKLKIQEYTVVHEKCNFDTCGIMFDVSQGSAVILPTAMERILQRMAVMGLNMLMIYMEDCFVLQGHPYFGYMRPQYTEDDLQSIDDYADIFGIEVIPCIQSIAHLIDVIKWPPYSGFADTADILMVGDERTYQFVEEMIVQAMKPFRTKRIHIGMDEAWKIGRGNYEDLHGPRGKHELMKEHLDRVYQITDKYGLEPMMWSDMFFNTFDLEGYGNNYNPDAPISKEIVDNMPEKLGLIFWEYNQTDPEFYNKVIRRHQEFKRRVYFAGGVYNCFGFGVNNGLAAATIQTSITACKENGVRDTFLTVWGDDTTENNIFSLFLSFQYLAEYCYRDAPSDASIKQRFQVCCQGNADDFWSMAFLDEIEGISVPGNPHMCNPSKYLLWQHPMYGLFDKNIEGMPLNAYYDRLAERFADAIQRNAGYESVFEIAWALCRVLAIKAELGNRLRDAYLKGDRGLLRRIQIADIPDLLARLRTLHDLHRTYWFNTNKPEGFDVIELRYGTQYLWLETTGMRVSQYLDGEINSIPEFEKERVPHPCDAELPFVTMYSRMVSASRISQTDSYNY